MRCPRPVSTLALFLLAGLAAAPAPAANPGRLSDSRRGEGEIARGPESEKLDEASVELRDSGYAEIVVRSFRGPYRFVGSWQPGTGNHVTLTITEAYGASGAHGQGWISIVGGTFEQVEIGGRNAVGGKIAVSFHGTGPGRPLQPEWAGLDSTRPGSGEFEYGRRRESLDQMAVEMRRDGSGEIRFQARRPIRLTGTWSEVKPDSVRFEINGGLEGASSGIGTIWFRRGELERVAIDGRASEGGFRVEFRAGATPTPRPPSGGDGRFTEEFGYDQPGADLRDFRADDLASCQSECARDSRCRAYTYNTPDRRCYLKSEERPMIRRSDCVTGVKRGGGGGSNGFDRRDGYNLEGGDYTSVFQPTVDECQDACRRDRECRAYTYNTRDRMCYLKDRVGDYSPRRDTVSGEKTGY